MPVSKGLPQRGTLLWLRGQVSYQANYIAFYWQLLVANQLGQLTSAACCDVLLKRLQRSRPGISFFTRGTAWESDSVPGRKHIHTSTMYVFVGIHIS